MSKNKISIDSIEEYVKIKNLLSILCRIPYVNYFTENLQHYFLNILDREEIDRYLMANQHKETRIPFDTIKNDLIDFAIKYFPEQAPRIISNFFEKARNLTIRDSLNEFQGSIILDDAYYKELEGAMRPILSFVGTKLYINNTINIITAPPGGGKSLFMMMEAIFQSVYNNKRSIMFVVGDMDEYAVLTRMRTILRHYSNKYPNINVENRINNLVLVIENYGSITIYDVVNRIEKEDFDFVFIDYDDNLIDIEKEEGSMYLAAARPYLVMDKYKHGKVVLFAAQGKPTSWKNEHDISVGFLAASSKKEHIADSIIVLRQPDRENRNLNELYILKDRHGINGAGKVIKTMIIKDGVFVEENKIL